MLSVPETPERRLRGSSAPLTLHVPDGRASYLASLERRPDGSWVMPTALAWTNAFRSEVRGPVGAPVRLDVEAAPSPTTPGATLLRVLVQVDRHAPQALRALRLRLDFFPLEVSAWRAPEQLVWDAPEAPLEVTLEPPPMGGCRVLFVEVDARFRYGGALGVATLTVNDTQRLVAPLERGHGDLDAASLDFRFFAAVFTAAEARHVGKVDFAVVEALLADSTMGQADREAFADQGLRRVESSLVRWRRFDWDTY